jgi:hypothetical protein
LFHTGSLADRFVFFSVIDFKERWKYIKKVFVRHLHDKTSGSSATKKCPYYLRDSMQFVTPNITKNRQQESNLRASHTEENEEDTQMMKNRMKRGGKYPIVI